MGNFYSLLLIAGCYLGSLLYSLLGFDGKVVKIHGIKYYSNYLP